MTEKICAVLIAVFLAFLLFKAIQSVTKELSERKKAYSELEDKLSEPEEAPARVVNTQAVIHKKGTKYPEHKLIYSAKFDLDSGEAKEFFSEEPLFEALKAGQTGILVYCGDTFLGFADFESEQQKEQELW